MSEESRPKHDRQRTKSESCECSKIIRRSSQQFSSIENLESLITCSIHLGLIDEPRQLPCGHAFCYSCLKTYLKHFSKPTAMCIICPLCRCETTLDAVGLEVLAPSIVHKQLTEYIILKRQKVIDTSLQCGQLLQETDRNLNEIKLELMRHLMNDFRDEISSSTKTDLEQQLHLIFNEHNGTLNRPNIRVRSLSDSGYLGPRHQIHSKKSDVYQHLDQNSIRKNMRKYREYKLVKSFTHPRPSAVLQVSWIYQNDTTEYVDDSEVIIYILKDSSMIFFSNLKGTKSRHFSLNMDGNSLCPVFVRYQNKVLLVVCSFNHKSILLRISLVGKILHFSKEYPGNLCGFCIDDSTETVIVAYPTDHSVLVFDQNTLEEMNKYNFGDLSPMYVAKSTNCREIWVSCPDDGRIAVYDEVSENYLHLDTSQIYESLPTHINETKDNRILFLDSSWSRIFWIRRWNNRLYIQLLIVLGVNEEMEIRSLEPMPENMILLSSNQWTYIAKPLRSVKDEHRKEKCTLL